MKARWLEPIGPGRCPRHTRVQAKLQRTDLAAETPAGAMRLCIPARTARGPSQDPEKKVPLFVEFEGRRSTSR